MEQTPSMISVYRGHYFDLLNPQGFDYDIEEIAHALSNLCRYTGHSTKFYSVAEHSVLVSRILPDRLALAGLLHDASEAYCGDVSKPLKELLPAYKEIEQGVAKAIFHHFGLDWPMHEEVHAADAKLYWAERATIAPQETRDAIFNQDNRATRLVTPTGMSPAHAKRMFLARYKELTNGQEAEGPKASAGVAT